MSDFNRAILVGRLTRDPELRYTPSGAAVCTLGLAINRKWRDKSDQMKEEVTFVNVSVWGKTGENCATYLKKGRPVLVEGRLQSRSWEKDGEKRTALDVVADSVQFLGGKDGAKAGSGAAASADQGGEDDIPF